MDEAAVGLGFWRTRHWRSIVDFASLGFEFSGQQSTGDSFGVAPGFVICGSDSVKSAVDFSNHRMTYS